MVLSEIGAAIAMTLDSGEPEAAADRVRGILARVGFVEKHDLWVGHNRSGDGKSLSHAGGIAVEPPIEVLL
jgi:ABC-type histidine transport system ATPase subunit